MADFGGLRYADLLKMIIETAQERIAVENGFNGNILVPKEKTMSDRVSILGTHDRVKVANVDLKSKT